MYQKQLKTILNENFKYDGEDVPLNRKVKGDVKKSAVYVNNGKGGVKKINFKDEGLKYTKRGKFKSVCQFANNPKSGVFYDCKPFGDKVDVNDK